MSRFRLGIAGLMAGLVALVAPPLEEACADERAPTSASSFTQDVHAVPLPESSLGYQRISLYPTPLWFVSQLVPSPELAFGLHRLVGPTGSSESDLSPAFGLRWELTPVLWSFGVHPKQPRWRFFIVDPIARVSGSLELVSSVEYIGGHIDKVLARPGLRVNLPVVAKGESLSLSFGTSAYAYNDQLRVAYDAGAYILAGRLGVQVTFAPSHAPLAAITSLRIRYF